MSHKHVSLPNQQAPYTDSSTCTSQAWAAMCLCLLKAIFLASLLGASATRSAWVDRPSANDEWQHTNVPATTASIRPPQQPLPLASSCLWCCWLVALLLGLLQQARHVLPLHASHSRWQPWPRYQSVCKLLGGQGPKAQSAVQTPAVLDYLGMPAETAISNFHYAAWRAVCQQRTPHRTTSTT